jgi:hypothetical protein
MHVFIAENSGTLVAGVIVAGIILSAVVKLFRDRKQKKPASCRGGCACCSRHA